jgi:hypothetical protein
VSRHVLVERVEHRACDACGREVDPENDSPQKIGHWYCLDLRVIGIVQMPDHGIDACSPRCLATLMFWATTAIAGRAESEAAKR